MNALSERQKIIISFMAGLLVGAALVGLWGAGAGDEGMNENEQGDLQTQQEEQPANTATESDALGNGGTTFTTPEEVVVENAAVSVMDQPAGNTVALESVTLSQSGWVAVHEEMDGALSNVLGARRFSGGTHDGGTVTLLRATEAGGTYHARLYLDDGDREFDVYSELPVVDNLENPVGATFRATE